VSIEEGSSSVPICVTFDSVEPSESNPRKASISEAARRATDPHDALLTPETSSNNFRIFPTSPGKAPLPAFIIPLSDRLLSEDVEYLVHKGAFTVPDHELQVEIFKAYMFSVHPFMPMLDSRTVTQALLSPHENGSPQVSLLLFQAIMFAGLHSLSLNVVNLLGFGSVKQAREVFFHRARLLYEFDVEPDSSAVLQSLILMSLWYTSGDQKQTWHWLGLACDVARTMGLHREPTKRHFSDQTRRFRRRLWWSMYVRDRWLSLGTRRPLRIRDDEFDVAMLTIDDFDLEAADQRSDYGHFVASVDERRTLALQCIQLCRLCVSIGHIMRSQYTILSSADIPHSIMVVPKREGPCTDELHQCDQELNEWFQALCKSGSKQDLGGNQRAKHSCSAFHWTVLNLTYWTAMNVLHRAQAVRHTSNSAEAQNVQKSSLVKAKDAARRLTKLSQDMLRLDRIRFVGLIGVTSLIASSLTHMLDVNAADEDVRDASQYRLAQSLEVLQRLSSIYASADSAVSFLVSVARKAGVSVPLSATAAYTETSPTSGNGTFEPRRESAGGHDQYNASSFVAGRQFDSFNTLVQAAAANERLQSLGHQGASFSSNMPTEDVVPVSRASPSDVAFASPHHGHMAQQRMAAMGAGTQPMLADPAFTELSTPADAGFDMNWSQAVDSNVGQPSNAFKYDFFSAAFGYLDGHYLAQQ